MYILAQNMQVMYKDKKNLKKSEIKRKWGSII